MQHVLRIHHLSVVQTKPLREHIKLSLGQNQSRCIDRIDREDFIPIMKKTRDDLVSMGVHPTDRYLEAGVFALKQYHAVAVLDPQNKHAVSDLLDPFWHAQILHTEQYTVFCDELVGHYIHHRPLDHGNESAVAELRALYPYTVRRIYDIFDVVDNEFYESPVSDDRLVCTHMDIRSAALTKETIFSKMAA